jgi:hypothetical protein
MSARNERPSKNQPGPLKLPERSMSRDQLPACVEYDDSLELEEADMHDIDEAVNFSLAN